MNYKFVKINEIKRFNIELSSKCALSCLRCPRTMFKGSYPIKDMSLTFVKKLFNNKLMRSIDKIYLVGNNGDPILNKEFHDIVLYFKMFDHLKLSIHTSGCGRSDIKWWKKTAQIFDENDTFIFSIDGLSDTNKIYRVNSKWEQIELAFKTMVSNSRSIPIWKFNIFSHNEHQITEAAKLAKKWGAKSFQAIKSDKYGDDYNLNNNKTDWRDELRPQKKYITCEGSTLPIEWNGSYANFDRISFKF